MWRPHPHHVAFSDDRNRLVFACINWLGIFRFNRRNWGEGGEGLRWFLFRLNTSHIRPQRMRQEGKTWRRLGRLGWIVEIPDCSGWGLEWTEGIVVMHLRQLGQVFLIHIVTEVGDGACAARYALVL